jgi:predicted DNA-binding protein (MmcQ/YjbR family)
MGIEKLRRFCLSLPHVTEDIKWGNDLCFCIGGKMFCVTGLDSSPTSASFKVKDEEFEEMSRREGFQPAPYMARHKWVYTADIENLSDQEWERYLRQSYELVKAKLPKKVLQGMRDEG